MKTRRVEPPRLGAIGPIRRLLRHEGWLVSAGLVLFALPLLPFLGRPLVDLHSFRQAQTAWPAVIWAEQSSIDLLHPVVPIAGPGSALPYDLPLFSAISSLLIRAGFGLEVALRSVGLVSFELSAIALYLVARRLTGRLAAVLTLGVYLVSPVSVHWASAAMVDLLAVALLLWGLYAALVWFDRGGLGWWLLAVPFIALGLMIKPNAGAMLSVLFVYRRPDEPWREVALRWRRISVLALVAVPAAALLWWSRSADAVKAANPLTAGQVSSELLRWFLGTPASRLDAGAWARLGGRMVLRAIPGVLPLSLVGTWGWFRQRPRERGVAAIVFCASGFLQPLIFFNVFVVHDYYLIGTMPALALAGALGFRWALARSPRLALGGVAIWAAVAAAAYPYWSPSYGLTVSDPLRIQTVATELRDATAPTDRIALLAPDWNPAYFLYADRQGWMISTNPPIDAQVLPGSLDDAIAQACSEGYRVYRLLDPPGVAPVTCP